MTEINPYKKIETKTSPRDMWETCKREVCALTVGALAFGSALACIVSDGGPTRGDAAVLIIGGATVTRFTTLNTKRWRTKEEMNRRTGA